MRIIQSLLHWSNLIVINDYSASLEQHSLPPFPGLWPKRKKHTKKLFPENPHALSPRSGNHFLKKSLPSNYTQQRHNYIPSNHFHESK